MDRSEQHLPPAEAARRLGVSAKALRLYEQRGLVTPLRSTAGWRAYGPDEMTRAREVVALRRLGLSLAQVARVLAGDAKDLAPALAEHQAVLEARARDLAATIARLGALRGDLAHGKAPAARDLARLVGPADEREIAFDLPWPWGGERFELRDIRAITYIVGPLGSGKTRLALKIAETLPGAVFLGLDRAADAAMPADPTLAARVARAMDWLVDDGAVESDALRALLVGLEAVGPSALVVDMLEQGLDHPTQEALIAHLRRTASAARPLFLMTRSNAILDLGAVGPGEAILYCPANHSPPSSVSPHPGARGYEALASCLASPAVRARTEGVIAWRPPAACAPPSGGLDLDQRR